MHRPAEFGLTDFAIARRSAAQAYGMAGLSPREIDVADIHDCFSI
jgi:acetyl-CoA acetyltransferase